MIPIPFRDWLNPGHFLDGLHVVPQTRDNRLRNVTRTTHKTLDRHRLRRPLQKVGESHLYAVALCELDRRLRVGKIAPGAYTDPFVSDVRGFCNNARSSVSKSNNDRDHRRTVRVLAGRSQ